MQENIPIEKEENILNYKWRLTETKYKKLRNRTTTMCLLFLVVLSFLVKCAMKVNPSAFMYNPMTDVVPRVAEIQSMLWWIVGAGWLAIIILFLRDIRKNKNHWLRKMILLIKEEEEGKGAEQSKYPDHWLWKVEKKLKESKEDEDTNGRKKED